MNIEEKSNAIAYNVILKQNDGNRNDEYTRAIHELAKACALLTSQIKAEREMGKAMVREWRLAGSEHWQHDQTKN